MISIFRNTEQKQLIGLSGDTKPTAGVENGAIFLEMDTVKVYIFDEANATWREL